MGTSTKISSSNTCAVISSLFGLLVFFVIFFVCFDVVVSLLVVVV